MESTIEFIVESSHVNERKQLDSSGLWDVFESGRVEWYENIGLSLGDLYQRGLELEIEDFVIRFRNPNQTLLNRKITLITQPGHIGNGYFVLRQKMIDDRGVEVADAEFRLLVVSVVSLEVETLPKAILAVFRKGDV